MGVQKRFAADEFHVDGYAGIYLGEAGDETGELTKLRQRGRFLSVTVWLVTAVGTGEIAPLGNQILHGYGRRSVLQKGYFFHAPNLPITD